MNNCCNHRCNQGRDCPERAARAKQIDTASGGITKTIAVILVLLLLAAVPVGVAYFRGAP